MDIISIITIALAVIGGATILLRIIAPMTKNKIDNKVLKVFEWILANISFDSKGIIAVKLEGNTLSIPLKKKK